MNFLNKSSFMRNQHVLHISSDFFHQIIVFLLKIMAKKIEIHKNRKYYASFE